MSDQIQLPEEVAGLISIVAERYGYYFAKRSIQSELMKATTLERAKVRTTGKAIAIKIGEYLSEGKDVRSEVADLQGKLATARATLKLKSAPYYAKMSPLTKAISYLDKVVIPPQIEKATGEKLLPRFQVSDYTLKAITKPK